MRNETAIPRVRAVALVWLAAVLLATAFGTVFGCASTSPERQQIHDSWEPLNRSLFRLNEAIDVYGFGPAARGYKFVTPDAVRVGVANAQRNLGFPARFVSCVGQAKLEEAGSELGRFVLNSTLGMGGLLDPASEVLPKYDEDLGLMLAAWHVPPGSYLMVPVFGPSTSRDATADLVAMAMNPLAWLTPAAPPVGALFAINRRAEADDEIRLARENSLDYYVALRDAYIQHRLREMRGNYAMRVRAGDVAIDSLSLPDDPYEVTGPESSEPR
jgi:phospholipid-binding lipoprotein MlaA